MKLVRHDECTPGNPWPGVTRRITLDRSAGTGGITAGTVELDPGAAIMPHTHLVEEAITVIEGDVLVLVGDETAEARGGGFSWVAPANVVHALRNIGQTRVRLVIAYPSVEINITPVDVPF